MAARSASAPAAELVVAEGNRTPELVANALGETEGPAAREFGRAYARRLGPAAPDPAELAAEAAGAFSLMARRDGSAAVRAFNPSRPRDRYEPPGSVLETNTEDLAFLVDTVAAEIGASGFGVRRVAHPIVGVERDRAGCLLRITDPHGAARRESVTHFELDRRLATAELAELERAVTAALGTLRRVSADFPAMRDHLVAMAAVAEAAAARSGRADGADTRAFLEWLGDNFVLLGYRQHRFEGGVARPVPASALGLCAGPAADSLAAALPAPDLDREPPLLVEETGALSPVWRCLPMQLVAMPRLDAEGRVEGEDGLLGLFTPRALAEPASRIPILDGKLARIVAAERLVEGSHDRKALTELFDAFPKGELLAAEAEELRRAIVALLSAQADEVVVVPRLRHGGGSASLIVSTPRADAPQDLGKRVEAMLAERFGAGPVTVADVRSRRDRVQLQVGVHRRGGVDAAELVAMRDAVRELARGWSARLRAALVAREGARRGEALSRVWGERMPRNYRHAVPAELAAADARRLEALATGEEELVIGVDPERGPDGAPRTRVVLCKRGAKAELSQATPLLENAGLRVIEEAAFRLSGGEELWVQGFSVLGPGDQPLDAERDGERFAAALTAAFLGRTESDSLDRLVLLAGLSWEGVQILRAYRRYRQRVGSRYTESFQNDAIAAHPRLVARLVELFERRFDPGREPDPAAEAKLRGEIAEQLDRIELLDHDRILRNQLRVIEATTRTNFYRPGRDAIAFKLRSAEVPAIPEPVPAFEIYVYSPRMEGIHLRGAELARGGLRWSDRMDFRTEVLGLLRAQITKNAAIVPSGAKGGFVLRGGAELEPGYHYGRFIEALLDLTDNLVEGRPVQPEGVRVHDEPDTYLVVAADKGTATFSDLANEISLRRGYWLGDAFASGGSSGYDHKGLGITARGAWESVKRHFRELGRDPELDPVTVVGIGDMSGDVFGNGMLLSPSIQLVAAFDHRHVFVDPAPDPAAAHAERRRLFALPRSSWADYDADLISAGGGVWSRQLKSIPVSAEMRALLAIEATRLAPAELIKAILRAPVDLLWNGGVGTFVKASQERHADVHDRPSEAIRVDADELRCRAIGEGGNLGLTPRARVEFSRQGGLVNADFLDNSAGVSCSDREVNVKILLEGAVRRGDLDRADRDAVLREATGEVVDGVLRDSFRQAWIVAREAHLSPARLLAYEDLIADLEAGGYLDRAVDALPDPEEMAERRRAGRGMERPELAVLLAHAKRRLVDDLLRSDLPDDPWFERDLQAYFPARVLARGAAALAEYPLRRELVAAVVVNDLVNSFGPTFVSGLSGERGAEPAQIVRATRVAAAVCGSVARRAEIEALDGEVSPVIAAALAGDLDDLVADLTRWLLAHSPAGSLDEAIAAGREGFGQMREALLALPGGSWRERSQEAEERLRERGVPPDLAREHALFATLGRTPDAITVARSTGRSVGEATIALGALGDALGLAWLDGEAAVMPASSGAEGRALQAAREDLGAVWAELAAGALEAPPRRSPRRAVTAALAARPREAERLRELVGTAEGSSLGLAELVLAVRMTRALIDTREPVPIQGS